MKPAVGEPHFCGSIAAIPAELGISACGAHAVAPFAQGRSANWLSDELTISKNTVRSHVRCINASPDVLSQGAAHQARVGLARLCLLVRAGAGAVGTCGCGRHRGGRRLRGLRRRGRRVDAHQELVRVITAF